MNRGKMLLIVFVMFPFFPIAQQKDSTIKIDEHYITLSEVVINQKLDVASFIKRVKEDTSFYKAFKNLRIVGYTAINDIRMLDKSGKLKASLKSRIQQRVANHCRQMDVLEQKVTGDFFDSRMDYNYYTAAMYAQLFFTKGKICGENNIVGNKEFDVSGLSGMNKHKAQLKMLFFNPGKKIRGLPFISNKTAIFDKSMAGDYDMKIDYDEDQPAYIFSIKAKPGSEKNVVVQEMVTWFDPQSFEITARNYSLRYDAGVYDFDVDMKVKMSRVKNLLVPSLITYNGNWKVIFKNRERGVFTATLFDFLY